MPDSNRSLYDDLGLAASEGVFVMESNWFNAARDGHTDNLQAQISAGVDVDARNAAGRTALMLAVDGRHVGAIRALLQGGASLEAEDRNGSTALTWAVANAASWVCRRHPEWPDRPADRRPMELLVAAGARLGLREAVVLGDVDLARRICDEDKSIDLNGEAVFFHNETFLMLAASSGSSEMVECLVNCGAAVDGMDDMGNTALMAAAEAGHASVVTLLLDRGADVDKGWPYFTALSQAEFYGEHGVASLLLCRGARRRLIDAIETGDVALAEALLRCGADSNIQHAHYDQASDLTHSGGYRMTRDAMRAVQLGNAGMVRLLLENGAADSLPHCDEHPLLAEAARFGHAEVVRLLIECGADVNAVGKDGLTALAWADREGRVAVMEQLKHSRFGR